jgi:hypothetical protein
MRPIMTAALVVAMLLGVGIYHGLATDRWGNSAAEEDSGKLFAGMPNRFGDWVGERLPRQADDDSKTAVINTRFTNRGSGKWVITSLTTGRSGRVAIHNPEHCYLGNGYKIADSIREESMTLPDGTTARFWTGHFQKKKPSGVESIRIYWGWTADGQWQAPSFPRLFFAAKPTLHKLYVIHPVPLNGAEDDSGPYKEFMTQYISELNRQIGP